MEVIIIEKKTFEEMTAKFDEFVKRIENACLRNSAKGMGECWTIRTCAGYSTSVPVPYSPFGITVPWLTARFTTKSITKPETSSVLFPLWRTNEKKPDSGTKRFEIKNH